MANLNPELSFDTQPLTDSSPGLLSKICQHQMLKYDAEYCFCGGFYVL